MTNVIWYPERQLMRIAGHAGAAPEGEDLVCAAISTLTWTLGAAAEEFAGRTEIDSARAWVEIRAAPEGEEDTARCRYLFEVIAGGFAGIAEKFPEYLRIEKR